MKQILLLSCFWVQILSAQTTISFVNPLIGTGGHGHTFPGPTMPFGACQPGPDTRLSGWDGCSGYHYSDSIIYGFSHTHLSGTGVSDYGDILLMPITKEMPLDNYQYKSSFSHRDEVAKAGYYKVLLKDPSIMVELTPTIHGALHRYTYPGKEKMLVLDLKHRDEVLDSKMEQIGDYTIQGYRYSKAWAKNQKVFFRMTFSHAISSIQYEPMKVGSLTSAIPLSKSLQCNIHFEANKMNPDFKESNTGNVVMVKISISGVDQLGAAANMIKEMPHWNFESYKVLAEAAWEKELGKIMVQDIELLSSSSLNSEESEQLKNKLIVFYTALYHCMIHPSIYSDVDGRYRGRDDRIHYTGGKFDYYTVFSLWDTYRALHPLLTILDPKRTNDFIQTFIAQYKDGGRLPVWEFSSNETNCMIGYHVVSVIWDAYQKGIRGYNAEAAFMAMKSIATDRDDYIIEKGELKMKEAARLRCADADALESYERFGYVRADDSHESVSKTLEYAYNDWCIAQMALALGKKSDYAYYKKRSAQWINVFDPGSKFMRARKNGTLYEPFSPYTVDNNFTEANSWQYSFYVPHDVDGLSKAHGGMAAMSNNLDQLFLANTKTEGREQADITGLIGQYAHGNEPSHQIVYLYERLRKQTSMADKVNFIRSEFYKNEPDGLIGNEDCGQMSAWYVMSALGTYPLCPGDGNYIVTEPLFREVILNGTKQLKKITGSEAEDRSYYTINKRSSITHRELTSKNVIYYKPETEIKKTTSATQSDQLRAAVPFINNAKRIFKDSLTIEINKHHAEPIYYSINKQPWQMYVSPIIIKENTGLRFCHSKAKPVSITNQSLTTSKKIISQAAIPKVQFADFTKLPIDRKVTLHSVFNSSYSAGGPDAIVDGIYGKLNWRAGDWQGYQGQDVEIIITLDVTKKLNNLGANFLQDQNSWIFYPKEVAFYSSDDSLTWNLIESIATNESDHNEAVSIRNIQVKDTELPNTRFIKMIAKNFGLMPQWHEGRGNPTFIFIDEIEVR